MELHFKVITLEDNLQTLVEQINDAQWDEANDVQKYAVDALQEYLAKQDTVLVVCYLENDSGNSLAGMASARIEQKPYDFEKWLYIDEVDTCSNFRQNGVGTLIMQKLLEIAEDNGCEEVWLGTETTNTVARRFYESLEPDYIEDVIGYTIELDNSGHL